LHANLFRGICISRQNNKQKLSENN